MGLCDIVELGIAGVPCWAFQKYCRGELLGIDGVTCAVDLQCRVLQGYRVGYCRGTVLGIAGVPCWVFQGYRVGYCRGTVLGIKGVPC